MPDKITYNTIAHMRKAHRKAGLEYKFQHYIKIHKFKLLHTGFFLYKSK
jgi:hypothetical protein